MSVDGKDGCTVFKCCGRNPDVVGRQWPSTLFQGPVYPSVIFCRFVRAGNDLDRRIVKELVKPFFRLSSSFGARVYSRLELANDRRADKDAVVIGYRIRRTAAMLHAVSSDTLSVSLPMRRRHFLLEHHCVSYILDDYVRFPTMEEVFVEITPIVRMRTRKGDTHVYVLLEMPVTESVPQWGDALMMIDGVPVPDRNLIRTYDPAIVKVIEVYPYRYNFGGSIYGGVVNLVTFKGNMPGVLFDDNVRIYGFEGCSWPEEHRGGETLYWHPMVTLEPGASVEIPSEGMRPGERYVLSVEGLAGGVRPVHLRKSFVR